MLNPHTEGRGCAAVAFLEGTKHALYEDRYRILSKDILLVSKAERGELFGVFDGIGNAEKGREAAQEMADTLPLFFHDLGRYNACPEGLASLLMEGNMRVHNWGIREGTGVPLGGCAGTVAWICDDDLHIFHAGDTIVLLNRGGETSVLTRAHALGDGAITRYFGLGPTLEIDVSHLILEDLDRVVLLTDGVTKALHPKEAGLILEEYADISMAAKALVQRSRSLGSHDDITALVIEHEAL